MKESSLDKFYSRRWIVTTISVSIGVFILVLIIADEANGYSKGLEGKHFAFATFSAFFVHVILIPKILWKFTLDRIRELGKAIRDED